MTDHDREPVADPMPIPPSSLEQSYLLLAAAGILHLVFALLSDMPEVLHQVLAVLEILIALGIGINSSNWRREYDAWVARNRGGQAQSSTGGG